MKTTFLSHAENAIRNRNIILHYIKNNSPVSRTGIWENINMSRASVTQIINKTQQSGLVSEVGLGVSTGGRKPLYLTFNGDKIKFISFNWEIQTLYIMDLNGKIFYQKKLDIPSAVIPDEFAKIIVDEINHSTTELKLAKNEIDNLILSLPGTIDASQNKVIYSVELGWQNVCVSDLFIGKFSGNIYIERTTNIISLCGIENPSQKDLSHFQLIILGKSGIGVSTVIHGGIQHGSQCMHGELGHIKLDNKTLCSCGQVGCLEAIVNKLFKENSSKLSNEILDILAVGVSTCVNIFDADIMLIGSYVDMMTDSEKEYLRGSIKSKVTASDMRHINIRFSTDKDKLSIMGMCRFMFDKMFPID